jgi:hypothetical protein
VVGVGLGLTATPVSTTLMTSVASDQLGLASPLGGAKRGLGAEAPCWLDRAFAEHCQHEAEAPRPRFAASRLRVRPAEIGGKGGTGRSRRGLSEATSKSFKGYKVPPTPDDLTQLYGGDMGVSFGHVVGQYTLLGKELEFKSRWTATLVKENGKWLLASYHVSFNALDNPLLNAAEKSLIWVAAGTGVLGVLIGVFLGRRKPAA